MDLEEIIFTIGLTVKNRCELIPDELVQEFLAACPPASKANFQSKSYEDQQFHAGLYRYHQYSLKEAERLGYKEGVLFLLGRYHWVIVESARGDEAGWDLAEKYGFDPRKAVNDSDKAKWFISQWRRDGDAVIFIGTRENWGTDDFHVGVVWAPANLVAKYESTGPDDMPSTLI